MKKFIFAVSILTVITHFNHYSQGTFHIVGNGNLQNANNNYPSIYGNFYRGVKNQFIVRASEMQAAGMSAGTITGMGFNVVSTSGATLDDFEIEIKTTSQNSITSWDNNNLTTCFGPVDYIDQTGWNQHDFNNPFQWDGVSNIIIKTCFYNNTWANNAVMKMSNYSYNTLIYRRRNNNPCTSNWINGVESKRPNIRFQWLDPNTPPICGFTSNSNSSCSGLINFTDQSSNNPNSWLWDFGDGNTSTAQNPSHTYTSSGNFDVQLISYNSFGSDTLTYPNFIQVNLAASLPVASSCSPITQFPGSFNCGITEFQFGNYIKTSSNSIEGYADFTCDSIGVFAGQFYPLLAVHNTNSTLSQNFSMWIDLNNNGIFEVPGEEIYSNIQADSSVATIQIPTVATLNTPLRLRIMADNSFSGGLNPCSNPNNGQAEDYTIFISIDTSPPSADFTSDLSYSCDGEVSFTDLSSNVPFAWYWDFGDGNNSIIQNPTHTYTNSGEYDVTLISTNAYGSDTLFSPQHIEVDTAFAVIVPNCSPSTLSYCCDYGISRVQFANINHPTLDGIEGYQDYSCEQQAFVEASGNYTLKVYTGPNNPQDTKAWVDFNNDGIFDNNEKVMEKLNTYDPVAIVQIPSNIISNVPFRLRISSDEVGANVGPCDDVNRGQIEDYALFVSTCPDPNNTSIGQVSKNTVQISWNPGGSENSWNIAYGQAGFNVQGGAGNTINNIFVNSYFVTGLTESTNYDFYVQANCDNQISNWVGPFNTTTLDISNPTSKKQVQIYPNPNNGLFSIISQEEITKIEVYDLIGKVIQNTEVSSNILNLDLTSEPKGIYFVRVLLKDSILLKKVICK
ncbi:MAG: GEVED domain-containing protein [Parvicellaceae bacterium]